MTENNKAVDFLEVGSEKPASPLKAARKAGDITCDVRAATCFIDNRATFLHKIRTIAESFDTRIICFNATMLAGKRHAREALRHAVRSFHNSSMVSNTLEMEALLFAAGSRQCSVAASFGVHEGNNTLFVCCYPRNDGVWDALAPLMCFSDHDGDAINPSQLAYLRELFGITPEEIATGSEDRTIDLVLERIALMEVYR